MSRARTITRRVFVIGAASVAGGVVLGWGAYRWPLRNPLESLLDDDDITLNPYLRIDPSGITLLVPRADVGQGAHSVQAAMIAEELDLAWGEFRVEAAPPSRIYYNGIAFNELLPVASLDDGALRRGVRGVMDAYSKMLGSHITGGSTTVPDTFDKLRHAGATARRMLLQAAAEETGAAVDALRTEGGAVITPDGRRLTYVSLAAAAATQRARGEIVLKEPSQWRLLGKPMQRVDIVAKSTGAATYGIDIRLPEMRYATVRAHPRAGGTVVRFDAAAAQAAKGVIKVVPITGGVGVIADNTWRAFRAAAMLDITWSETNAPATTDAIAAELAASFTDARRDARLRNDGDVESVPAAAATMVEAEYRVPFLAHAPLEPMNATALSHGDALEIWTGTQVPRFAVRAAAAAVGLDESRVRLHEVISGGSFGRRLEVDYVVQAAELAMAQPGVPIKMTWSRAEDFTHDFPRPMAIGRGRGAVMNGQVHAFDLQVASISVVRSQAARINQMVAGPDAMMLRGAFDQPYAIPHYRVTAYAAPELVPVSSWRSVGASYNGFLHESLLDELIHAAGADPLLERIRLCNDPIARRVLETVGEMSGWSTPLGAGRGRGVALTLSFGVPCAEVVEVTNTPEGISIDKVFVAADVGRVLDPVNFENQVQGAVIWGLSHAMNAELTYRNGVAEQTNFHLYEGLRLNQTPEIVVRGLEHSPHLRGVGEPPVPPAAPALANAIFAATGTRLRELPMRKSVRFR